MGKERGRNDMRSRIAHLAARLMAEDGIEDHALAKRKAARQAGAPDSRQLPTNDEIDAELRAYRQLYQGHEHREHLRALRGKALKAMRELERFNPYLTGSVLSGSAGKYADINLQLYTDNAKAVELYLIDQRIPYKAGQGRVYSGEEPRTVPVFTVSDGGTEIELAVFGTGDLRTTIRTTPAGRALERAKAQAVEELLTQA